LPLFPFSVLWGLSSEVFIRGFISSLPQRAWDKKALLLLWETLVSTVERSSSLKRADAIVEKLNFRMRLHQVLFLKVQGYNLLECVKLLVCSWYSLSEQ
jgi:hypothetical protein